MNMSEMVMTGRVRVLAALGAVAVAMVLGGCSAGDETLTLPTTANGDGDGEPEPMQTIAEIVAQDTAFSTLELALDTAELVDDLDGQGPFTVFAPTNQAFEALPEGTLDTLLANVQSRLTPILLYHVVGEELMAVELTGRDSVSTLEGSAIQLAVVNGDLVLNGTVMVVTADIEAENGVVHVIDAVLIPPSR
jgi:uncharacterized surface protein with fasciclin (FAS1) repeats